MILITVRNRIQIFLKALNRIPITAGEGISGYMSLSSIAKFFYYVRSKVRNGLIDQIKDMNQDGNVETAQENLNKFIEEIKTMPIAINQSNANDQHYEVPSEFYVKVLGSYLKYSCGLWPNDDTTLEESELEMLKLYCQRADLKKGIFLTFPACF